MVLEILVSPKKVSGKPWEMYFIGLVYSLFAVGLSWWVFKDYISIIMITFTAIAAIPFIHGAITQEEKKSKKFLNKINLLKEHTKIISMFTFLFLGFVTAYLLLYLVLPSGAVENVFKTQINTIITVHSTPSGNFFSYFTSMIPILFNNIKVMFFCLVFSFFYGVGAIFILSWNASIMGTAVGNAIRQGLSYNISHPLQTISMNLIGYFVHGIPEIIAYFMVGVAGGIFSIALMKEKFMSKKFKRVSFDCVRLIVFAFILLVAASLIEIFISPYFLA